MFIIWLSLFSGHGARLIVERVGKKAWPFRALCEGNTRTCKFSRENFKIDLNENKKGLGNVRWKSSKNNTSFNISIAFLESCLSIRDANECQRVSAWSETKKLRIKVNGNIWRRTQRKKQGRKWTKIHIINVLLVSFARSVWKSICLLLFFHRSRSFVARSVRYYLGQILPINKALIYIHIYKSWSTLCRKSWVFSGFSGFLPQGSWQGGLG